MEFFELKKIIIYCYSFSIGTPKEIKISKLKLYVKYYTHTHNPNN